MGWSLCAHRLLAAALPPSALSASLDTFHYPCGDSSRMADPPGAAPRRPVRGFGVPPVRAGRRRRGANGWQEAW